MKKDQWLKPGREYVEVDDSEDGNWVSCGQRKHYPSGVSSVHYYQGNDTDKLEEHKHTVVISLPTGEIVENTLKDSRKP